jgi:phosphoribosylformylglycinamidine cyclo-ligase
VTDATGGISYASAGVDIDGADHAVELMRAAVDSTRRPEVVGSIGGFSGLFDVSALTRWRRPLLATSTDGVGTKLVIAQRFDKHDTVGIDLVAMVADDLVVCGAEPLFLTDYIACGKVVPTRIASIVAGVAKGCVAAGCALVGGEIAEHPGVMPPDDYDLAAAATGAVEADQVLGRDKVTAGDAIVVIGSSGIHSNGYSLVRKVLLELAGWQLSRHVDEFGRSLGEELLEPTIVYAKACLDLVARVGVHAFVHVTGGGIPGNVPRVLPADLDAVLDRSAWTVPPVFEIVRTVGGVALQEMERAFNMGAGMIAVVAAADADAAVRVLTGHGLRASVAGHVEPGTGTVRLNGAYLVA